MAWKHNPKPPSGIPARGEGYGGPASHAPRASFSAENQPAPEAKAAGHDVAREVRDRIAARRFEITDRLIHNAINGTEQGSNQAGQFLINKLVPPSAAVDVTSAGKALGGYVISAPAEIEDAGEWAKQHKPR